MKKLRSEANKLFKKHFWKFLLIDFSFIVLLFAFILYSRAKIKAYITLVNQYAAQIVSLQAALQQESVEGLMQLQVLLEVVEPLATRMTLFVFLLVPSVIVLLWSVSQAANYTLINKGKFFSLRHYIIFLLFTIPLFLAAAFIVNLMLALFSERLIAALISWQFYLYFILLALLFYFAQMLYSFVSEKKIVETLVKGLKASLFRFHRLFPIYLGYFFIFLLIAFQFLSGFVKYMEGDYKGLLVSAIPVLLLLLLLGWYRVFFTLKARA